MGMGMGMGKEKPLARSLAPPLAGERDLPLQIRGGIFTSHSPTADAPQEVRRLPRQRGSHAPSKRRSLDGGVEWVRRVARSASL